MAKIIQEAWNGKNVHKKLKKQFFKKLRDLCCLYGVIIEPCEVQCPQYLKENENDYLDAISFNFYDGSNYIFYDRQIDYSYYNEFENEKNHKDIIKINGVRYDQQEND